MNRREFLARVPAYASVPALLSLPSVARATPIVAPWLRALEAATLERRNFWLGPLDVVDGVPEWSWTIVIHAPGDRTPNIGHVGGVNRTPVGCAPAGTLMIRGMDFPLDGAFTELRFAAHRKDWNTFLGAKCFVNFERVFWYPEVDFYSL